VLKELIVGAAAIAAGLVPLSGVASADADQYAGGRDGGDEIGLLNLANVDALHNVNVTGGVCDNNINVLGVQVVLEDVANGLALPVFSPDNNVEDDTADPENCASSDAQDGGTVQGR
jgi:hypothetical protein